MNISIILDLNDFRIYIFDLPQFIKCAHRTFSQICRNAIYPNVHSRVSVFKSQDNTGCSSFQLLIYGLFFSLEDTRGASRRACLCGTSRLIYRSYFYLFIFCIALEISILISLVALLMYVSILHFLIRKNNISLFSISKYQRFPCKELYFL